MCLNVCASLLQSSSCYRTITPNMTRVHFFHFLSFCKLQQLKIGHYFERNQALTVPKVANWGQTNCHLSTIRVCTFTTKKIVMSSNITFRDKKKQFCQKYYYNDKKKDFWTCALFLQEFLASHHCLNHAANYSGACKPAQPHILISWPSLAFERFLLSLNRQKLLLC